MAESFEAVTIYLCRQLSPRSRGASLSFLCMSGRYEEAQHELRPFFLATNVVSTFLARACGESDGRTSSHADPPIFLSK